MAIIEVMDVVQATRMVVTMETAGPGTTRILPPTASAMTIATPAIASNAKRNVVVVGRATAVMMVTETTARSRASAPTARGMARSARIAVK